MAESVLGPAVSLRASSARRLNFPRRPFVDSSPMVGGTSCGTSPLRSKRLPPRSSQRGGGPQRSQRADGSRPCPDHKHPKNRGQSAQAVSCNSRPRSLRGDSNPPGELTVGRMAIVSKSARRSGEDGEIGGLAACVRNGILLRFRQLPPIMRLFLTLMAAAGFTASSMAEKTQDCSSCRKAIILSGEFAYQGLPAGTTIESALPDAAFSTTAFGDSFEATVMGLAPGDYALEVDMAETRGPRRRPASHRYLPQLETPG